MWLDAAMTQIGLAMARSIGDHAVKPIGVIAEPEVTQHTIEVRRASYEQKVLEFHGDAGPKLRWIMTPPHMPRR